MDVILQENQPHEINYDQIMAEQALKLSGRRGSEGLDKKRPLINKDRTHWDSADEIRIEAKQDKAQDNV